jgi:hypothetical protein
MVIFRSAELYPEDDTLDWDGKLEAAIDVCLINGKHINRRDIMNEPFVRSLAEELRKYLQVD